MARRGQSRGPRDRGSVDRVVSERQRVVVVTGGGGGIGRAVAEDLGRGGWFVVTVDPLVSLDGTTQLPEQEETTAGRIIAAGGIAKSSSASVTDSEGLSTLFQELADEHGGLDAVVNVAGITRQSGFAHGSEADWLALLSVHLGGYLNVLGAALPLMANSGYGRILGVTSGSGWRAADAGGYSCAKRAVASLTWQLGREAPPGVVVNAMSPIAATRMVAAALERARAAGRTGGGGVSFTSMSGPEDLGPLGAHLVGDGFGWCNGRVFFTAGPEMAVVDQPRLLEVVRTENVGSLTRVVEAVTPRAFARAEKSQLTDGGSNSRFGPIFDESVQVEASPAIVQKCMVVSDLPVLGSAVIAALEARSVACHLVDAARGFSEASDALNSAVQVTGPIDGVVVAISGRTGRVASGSGWERLLAEHDGIIDDIHSDAAWARAAADYAASAGRPVRLVTVTGAETSGGRSRAQASAQLARVGASTTEQRVAAFAVSLEGPEKSTTQPVSELVAYLLANEEASDLAGAELVVGAGWFGLRSHPRVLGSVTYGGPQLPSWLDSTLMDIVGVR
jgi:NAD(P)-dependent dehydrogenase (short-subunit alcohol dehydrogenase family)